MRLSVVGLGYVGLPLAVALAEHYRVIGYDIDGPRIEELLAGKDRTGEVSSEQLAQSTLELTNDTALLRQSNVFIVTVPTPVDDDNKPDLSALISASRIVGEQLAPGAIVVFESTVWPGVTEEVCGPELERSSGMTCPQDFRLGYSPERINPGDQEHTIGRITKIVAGDSPEVAAQLAQLYGKLNGGEIHVAPDIRTAEAAKVIENAQRDINIAFVNEVAKICHKLDVSTLDVLAAANTKWNFMDFRPGLVGGHCIGVDPYYLAHRAVAVGHDPEMILAGRRINDSMGSYVAATLADTLGDKRGRVLVLGLTFKENVPDLRNSRVIDIVCALREYGYEVDVYDPIADPEEAREFYGVELLTDLDAADGRLCVIGAVAHDSFCTFTAQTFEKLVAPNGLVADIKGMWSDLSLPPSIRRWQL